MTRMPEGIPAISVDRLRRLLAGIDATLLLVINENGNLSLLSLTESISSAVGEQHVGYVGYIDLLQHIVVFAEDADVLDGKRAELFADSWRTHTR